MTRRVLVVLVLLCAAIVLAVTPLQSAAALVSDYVMTSGAGVVLDGGTDIGLRGDDSAMSIALPFPVTLYNRTFTHATISSNGNIQFASSNTTPNNAPLPRSGFGPTIFAYWDDLRTDSADLGTFTQVTGTAPDRVFHVRWRARYFRSGVPGSIDGNAEFEVLLHEGRAEFDLIYAGGTPGTAGIGVQLSDTGPFTEYSSNASIDMLAGVKLTFTGTGVGVAPADYSITTGTGTLLDGGADIGNHHDDQATLITLPFTVGLYDQVFTTARVGANGNIQFVGNSTSFNNTALPATTFRSTIFAFWEDLRTDGTDAAGQPFGIFTQTTGVAPHRVFHLRWHAAFRGTGGARVGNADFEVLLHEESTTFDVIYGGGTPPPPINPVGATIGVQTAPLGLFTQYSATATIDALAGTRLTFSLPAPNTPPAADAGPDQTLEATSSTGALFTLDGTGSTDAEGPLAYDWSFPSGTASGPSPDVTIAAPPPGQQSVTYTATLTVTDERNESDSDTVELTVTDTTGPEIFGSPGDFSLEGDRPGGAHVDFGPLSATDVVDGDQPVACSHSPGFFALGPSEVSSSDLHTNSSHASFTITVVDTTEPALTLPDPITVHAAGPGGTGVAYVATAADVVSGAVAVNCHPLPGSTFPLGITTVNCGATDGSGNSADGSFTVTVTNTAPICSGTPGVSLLWPPDHRMVPVAVNGVSDPDGDPLTLQVTDVRQDEPTTNKGDGDTPVDAAGVGTAVALVRAERTGSGNGRVYHIFYSATDSVGASCNGTVTVGVPHDQGKGSVPVDGGPIFSSLVP
jgi:hypothetical protein